MLLWVLSAHYLIVNTVSGDQIKLEMQTTKSQSFSKTKAEDPFVVGLTYAYRKADLILIV